MERRPQWSLEGGGNAGVEGKCGRREGKKSNGAGERLREEGNREGRGGLVGRHRGCWRGRGREGREESKSSRGEGKRTTQLW